MPLSLVRHTTPRVEPGTCYGKTDLEVADSFPHEAAKVEALLEPIERIVCSPLLRCRRLADFLAEKRGIPVEFDSRLREMDFGNWEGQLWDNIPRVELDEWSTDFMHARSHGGESVAMLRSRVVAALSSIQSESSRVLAVTHAGVIKVALAHSNGGGEAADDFKTEIEFGEIIALPVIAGL